MEDIIFKMFEGWVFLGVLMLVPAIYLLFFRDLPKKLLFLLSAAIITAGSVNILYYLFDPVVFWVINIVPEICVNRPDAFSCRFFRSVGGFVEELDIVLPIVTSILVSHIMARKLWIRLASS